MPITIPLRLASRDGSLPPRALVQECRPQVGRLSQIIVNRILLILAQIRLRHAFGKYSFSYRSRQTRRQRRTTRTGSSFFAQWKSRYIGLYKVIQGYGIRFLTQCRLDRAFHTKGRFSCMIFTLGPKKLPCNCFGVQVFTT